MGTIPSFLTVPSSNLRVTKTAIESETSSSSGYIHPLTSELPALEHRKNVLDTIATSVFNRSSSNLQIMRIAHSVFIGSSSNLQITRTDIKSRMCSMLGQIGPFALDETCPWAPKHFPIDFYCCGHNNALLLIVSSSNLQVTRTAIKYPTSSNSGHIRPLTLELAAL